MKNRSFLCLTAALVLGCAVVADAQVSNREAVFARPRKQVVSISECGGTKKRDDFWVYLHRAATAEGVKVAFVDTWAGSYGCKPMTEASAVDEKAFAARPDVLMEGAGNGFRANR